MSANEEGNETNRGGGPTGRPDRLDRRILIWGGFVSLALHALAFLLVRGAVATFPAAASPARDVDSKARPADALVALGSTSAAEIVPPPRPPLAVAEPRLVETGVPTPAPILRAPAPASRAGAGSATGETRGDARTGRQTAGGGSPAVPRSVFPEWDPPASVRGMEVTVRVRVDTTGRPTGEVELVPPTPDRAFNRRLMNRAIHMEYRPATRDGVPVAGWAEITFVFQGGR